VIVNPGGTNERFARAPTSKNAEIKVHNDNVTIFDEIAKGNADLMMTDLLGRRDISAEAASGRAVRGASGKSRSTSPRRPIGCSVTRR